MYHINWHIGVHRFVEWITETWSWVPGKAHQGKPGADHTPTQTHKWWGVWLKHSAVITTLGKVNNIHLGANWQKQPPFSVKFLAKETQLLLSQARRRPQCWEFYLWIPELASPCCLICITDCTTWLDLLTVSSLTTCSLNPPHYHTQRPVHNSYTIRIKWSRLRSTSLNAHLVYWSICRFYHELKVSFLEKVPGKDSNYRSGENHIMTQTYTWSWGCHIDNKDSKINIKRTHFENFYLWKLYKKSNISISTAFLHTLIFWNLSILADVFDLRKSKTNKFVLRAQKSNKSEFKCEV